MNKTKIEWVKNPDGSQGYTWNPITGCLNHVNGLCNGGGFPCYAYKLANGRLKQRYLANKNWDTRTPESYEGYPNLDPFYPRFWEEKMEELAKRNESINYKRGYSIKPRGIFPCDMSDLFGIGIPAKWTQDISDLIVENNYDRFYLLTKQPQNLFQFSPFPENVYIGVTATDTYMAVKGLQCLGRIEARVKFISFEPLLSQTCMTASSLAGIDWVILGAQTRPYKPPEISWLKEIVEAADRAGIPVFLKDNLKPLLVSQGGIQQNIFWKDKRDAQGFEKLHLELRQEMPEILYCSTCRVRRR